MDNLLTRNCKHFDGTFTNKVQIVIYIYIYVCLHKLSDCSYNYNLYHSYFSSYLEGDLMPPMLFFLHSPIFFPSLRGGLILAIDNLVIFKGCIIINDLLPRRREVSIMYIFLYSGIFIHIINLTNILHSLYQVTNFLLLTYQT